MKKAICIDARMALNSGIGTYIRSLIPRLKDQYHIRLLVDPKSISKCPEIADCELIPLSSPVYSAQEQFSLPLKIPRCDLFWTPHFNIPLAPVRAKKRLATIHDVFFLAHTEHLELRKRVYARLFFNAAMKQSDHVITVSEFSLSEISNHIGPYQDKITKIPLGIRSESFKKNGVKVEAPSKYILYVGNFAIHKNIIRLIRSLDFLPSDVHLVLVGYDRKWDGWKKEAEKRKDRITIYRNVSQENLVWLYQNAQMLIHPSLYEGFGLTPLEAMSAGCPVVASNVASLPEVCGDAALYVDPMSEKDIARGIETIWKNNDLSKELRKKGFIQTQAYDLDICAKKHIEVIDQVLES